MKALANDACVLQQACLKMTVPRWSKHKVPASSATVEGQGAVAQSAAETPLVAEPILIDHYLVLKFAVTDQWLAYVHDLFLFVVVASSLSANATSPDLSSLWKAWGYSWQPVKELSLFRDPQKLQASHPVLSSAISHCWRRNSVLKKHEASLPKASHAFVSSPQALEYSRLPDFFSLCSLVPLLLTCLSD